MHIRILAAGILLVGLAGCDVPTETRAPGLTANAAKSDGPLLEVKFREELQVRLDAMGQPQSARGANLASLRAALARLRVAAVRPLVTLPVPALEAMAREATQRSGQAAPDLASWYHLNLPAGTDTVDVVAQLRALPEVSDAYPVPEPAPPPVTPNFAANQNNYFGAAPSGSENVYARSLAGGRGAGIRIIDLEYDWWFTHEDLGLSSSILITGQQYGAFGSHHGTAVLGMLVARDNGIGIIGGAPDAIIRVASPMYSGAYNAANAISASSAAMSPGDVLLIEQQTGGPGPAADDYVPLEYVTSVYDAIRLASLAGRVVVEAAGNGNQNLDDPIFSNRFNRNTRDSRAIIVGAGDGANARLSFSSYGSRVDVQGHGCCVTTTGYGGLWGTTLNDFYTSSFNGTSSASPVVASAATVLQGYLRHGAKPLLAPNELSHLLKTTGSPQTGNTAQRIGPKPNLRSAIATFGAAFPAPWLDLRCSTPPSGGGGGASPRVVAEVKQNVPGSTMTLERRAIGTTNPWSVIKTWTAAPAGVQTYNVGFTSGEFRARSTQGASSSAYSLVVAKNC